MIGFFLVSENSRLSILIERTLDPRWNAVNALMRRDRNIVL